MDSKKWKQYGAIAILIILFGLFIYPGLYKYDKLSQNLPVKINRITGSTQVLSNSGWRNVDDPSGTEIEQLRKELNAKLTTDRESIKQEIANKIKDDIVNQVKNDISQAKKEIENFKTASLDPDNNFTLGSTQDEVKKIMGIPTNIISVSPFDTWYYGNSTVSFENKKVRGWDNSGKNLKIK